MTRNGPIGFEISISGRDDGTLEAAYIYFSSDSVAETREIKEDVLLADFNARGELVGIEILAPVTLADLEKLVDRSRLDPFSKFIRENAPKDLVLA